MDANKMDKMLPERPFFPPGTRVYPMATRWKVKQSLLWSDMSVEDPWGEKRFRVTSEYLWYDELRFSDTETGEEIGRIQQRLSFGLPKYSIVADARLLAVVKQKFAFLSFLKCLCYSTNFTIELVECHRTKSCDCRHMRMRGRNRDRSHTLERENGGVVAEITRGFTYISPGEDVFFALACCIVVAKCKRR